MGRNEISLHICSVYSSTYWPWQPRETAKGCTDKEQLKRMPLEGDGSFSRVPDLVKPSLWFMGFQSHFYAQSLSGAHLNDVRSKSNL